MKSVASLLAVLALATGCYTPLTSRKVMSLDRFHRVFVQSELNDNHHIDASIAAELKARGYDASFGPHTMMPENAEAVITYSDRWEWDFKTYMIELKLEAFTAHTEKKLGEARYYHPSIRSETPERVIHDLVASLSK